MVYWCLWTIYVCPKLIVYVSNIVEVCNSVFTPVFTDPKIVLKMGVVDNADLCVFWTRELKGNLEHRTVQVSDKIEIHI